MWMTNTCSEWDPVWVVWVVWAVWAMGCVGCIDLMECIVSKGPYGLCDLYGLCGLYGLSGLYGYRVGSRLTPQQ
jgi:hypothetical protein